ncbi:RDD family protein [Pseudoxanthomonas koreensis]|uniref:RDD family protein n=1 Tax=Pseudoxanthomonas koreensis TaxID=266061 RepID=UPI0013912138|nr:RDD family protein [Pseudoxanthomonas koreensis]KAF1697149.1 transporter [Pseudoxanthomonas koreensis]
MTEWYYADRQRRQIGPQPATHLAQRYRAGELDAATLVWREGLPAWQPLGSLRGELGLDEAGVTLDFRTPVAPPPAVDERVPPPPAAPAAYATHAAYAAPAPAVPVQDGPVVLAGFWKRVAASIIDAFAIGIPVAIVAAIVAAVFGAVFGNPDSPFDPVEMAGTYLLSALAFGWFHSNASMMATPGKLAIGIKVVRPDGGTISFLRGFARYWGYLLSSLLLCIGLLMAAFTERKQALHDLLCDTLVVDKWAFTGNPEWQRPELGTVAIVVLVLFGLLLLGIALVAVVAIGTVASMKW